MAPHRPSLMVMCDKIEPDAAIASLMKWCEQPFHICGLPGPLSRRPQERHAVPRTFRTRRSPSRSPNDWIERGAETQIVRRPTPGCGRSSRRQFEASSTG
jgi:hypothetical protein